MSRDAGSHDWTEFVEASATAASSLTVATATATATELPRVAEASLEVQQIIINIMVAGGFDNVPKTTVDDLVAKTIILRDEMSMAEFPSTHTFKCDKDLRACIARATGLPERAWCCVVFVACVFEGAFKGFVLMSP